MLNTRRSRLSLSANLALVLLVVVVVEYYYMNSRVAGLLSKKD